MKDLNFLQITCVLTLEDGPGIVGKYVSTADLEKVTKIRVKRRKKRTAAASV